MGVTTAPRRRPDGTAGRDLKTTRLVVFLAALGTVLLAFGDAPLVGRLYGWPLAGRVMVVLPYFAVLGGAFFVGPRIGGVTAMGAGAVGVAALGIPWFVAYWEAGALAVLRGIVGTLVALPVPFAGVLFAQLQLLLGGRALWKAEPLPRWRTATVALAALAAFLSLQMIEHARLGRARAGAARPTPREVAPSEMAEGSLNLTLPCLARYANEHGEYPETLVTVGPRGSKCVPDPYSSAIPGYVVSYEPRKSAEHGTRDSFSLRYEPVNKDARAYGFFQTDETGIVYRGVDANSRPQDPTGDPTETLGFMTGSLEYFRMLSGTNSYPRTLQESTPARSIDAFAQFRLAPERDAPKLAGRFHGYRFQYTPGPPDDADRIVTYRFDARPVLYGRDYRRSYMCESSGHFHATDEDRAAEPADPNPRFDAGLKEELPGPCYTLERARLQYTNGRRR